MPVNNGFGSLSKRALGDELEKFAEKELVRHGCKIIERNFQCKLGEIDIIAKDKQHLIFVEVRYRKSDHFGGADVSVDLKKQQKLIRTASLYLQKNKLTNKVPARFDVMAITGNINKPDYNWIKDAFGA